MKNHPEFSKQSRKKIIFVSIIGFITIYFLLLAFLAKSLLYSDMPSPTHTPTIFCCVDGAAGADIFTWLDLNGNGKINEGEPPLVNIAATLWYSDDYPPLDVFASVHSQPYEGEGDGITDRNGQVSLSIFMPGCARNCSEGYSVAVEVPAGYVPTTSIIIKVKDDPSKVYEFGFQKSP